MEFVGVQLSHPNCTGQYVDGLFAIKVDVPTILAKVKGLPADCLVLQRTEVPLGRHNRLSSRLLVGVSVYYGEYPRDAGFIGVDDYQERQALAVSVSTVHSVGKLRTN